MQTNFEFHSRMPQPKTLEAIVQATLFTLRQLTSEVSELTDIEVGDTETEGLHRIAVEDLYRAIWKAANEFEGKLR
ncbi:MAG: hypothetical protein ACE361_01480 [Aureliella sp.]